MSARWRLLVVMVEKKGGLGQFGNDLNTHRCRARMCHAAVKRYGEWMDS